MSDIIVEAGAFCRLPFPDLTVTGADWKNSPNGFHGFPNRSCTGIRAEVFVPILFYLSCQADPGIFLLCSDFDIGIVLVIFQQNIIPGPMLFYEIAFQNQCFHFGIRQNIVKIGYIGHHGSHFPGVRGPEILSDPVLQGNRFSDVYDFAVLVFHNIDSRGIREIFQLGFHLFVHARSSFIYQYPSRMAFRSIFPATVAAFAPPVPAFSRTTAIASVGLSAGANPINQEWGL